MSNIVLSATNLCKSYTESENTLHVLKNINFDIEKGEVIAITGESGSGKSTLLNIVSTLDNPDSGSIKFNGLELPKNSDKKISKFRLENIGFLFQFHHLMRGFTALENVMMPALIKGESKKEAKEKALFLIEKMGLTARIKHLPGQLSGGEQQRIAMARALINKPAVVLADEPAGNLDNENSEKLFNLIFKLAKEFKQTFLIATHNPVLSARCDRVFSIQNTELKKGH